MDTVTLDLNDGRLRAVVAGDDAAWLADELSSRGADGMAAALKLESALEQQPRLVTLEGEETFALFTLLAEQYDELEEPLLELFDALSLELGGEKG